MTGELLHPSDRRIKAAIAPVSGNQQLKNIQNVQVIIMMVVIMLVVIMVVAMMVPHVCVIIIIAMMQSGC